MRRVTLISAMVVLSCACAPSMNDAARKEFTQTSVCPQDNVRVDEYDANLVAPPPPPEIVNDPARSAEWNDYEAQRAAETPPRAVFIARGCGAERVYTCWHPRNHRFTTVCSEVPPGTRVPVPGPG
jgi:hypothetical protein